MTRAAPSPWVSTAAMTPAQTLALAMLRPAPRDPLARRDAQAIAAFLEIFGPVFDAWFEPEITGQETVPDGASLIVGSHNGGIMTPDMWLLMIAGWRRFGPELPSYGLAHDQVMHVPGVARLIGLLGGVPARQENASALLERGARVLVYPGGDVDTFKPWSERHTVKFAGRTGFVRLALRRQVPIVPVVSVGAHETFRVLTDGRALARALHLKHLLRVEVLPVFLCVPWGVWVGPFEMHVPMPSKIRIRVLPPMRFDLPPSAADDDAIVHALAEEVRRTMQTAVDQLARVPGYGVRARLADALRSGSAFPPGRNGESVRPVISARTSSRSAAPCWPASPRPDPPAGSRAAPPRAARCGRRAPARTSCPGAARGRGTGCRSRRGCGRAAPRPRPPGPRAALLKVTIPESDDVEPEIERARREGPVLAEAVDDAPDVARALALEDGERVLRAPRACGPRWAC